MSETPRIIKKYPNRRLYDTANSGYITLADVKQMVLDNIEFQVIDAKSGDDLSRAILLQIILEEEAGGMPMFSSEMLAQMIRFYGSAQQTIMGSYIEQNVKAFLAIQKKLQDQAKQIYGDKMMLTPDLWKQFMQMQAPAMQGMLGNYLEQSAKLFMDMQQRMQDQTRGMFAAFPFPNFAAGPQTARRREEALTRRRRGATTTRCRLPLLRRNRARRVGPEMNAAQIRCTRATSPRAIPDASCGIRLARVPEGARRFRADRHAARRRGLRDRAELRRCGSGRRQYLRLHRRGSRRIARRDRRGACREWQGDRHRLSRREGRRPVRPRRASEGARGDGPARHGGGAGGRPRAPAAAARSLRRPRAAAGGQAHAVPLRVSQDQRRLQPSLHVLHHPVDAGRSREPAARRGHGGSRAAPARRSTRASRDLAGHERLWGRRPLPNRVLAGPAGEDADDGTRDGPRRARAGARRMGTSPLRLSVSARGRGRRADDRGSGARRTSSRISTFPSSTRRRGSSS